MAFANSRLGPASRELVAAPLSKTLLLSRLRDGVELEDAVLLLVHREADKQQALAGEFLGYFFDELAQHTRSGYSSGLYRLLDTQDLLQSVAGDVWSEFFDLTFEDRRSFMGLLRQRLRWKVSDRARDRKRARRREDLRVDVDPAVIDPGEDRISPAEALVNDEERSQLEAVIDRLSQRDSTLLRMSLDGDGIEEMMVFLEQSRPTTRRALLRALERAHDLAEMKVWQNGPGES